MYDFPWCYIKGLWEQGEVVSRGDLQVHECCFITTDRITGRCRLLFLRRLFFCFSWPVLLEHNKNPEITETLKGWVKIFKFDQQKQHRKTISSAPVPLDVGAGREVELDINTDASRIGTLHWRDGTTGIRKHRPTCTARVNTNSGSKTDKNRPGLEAKSSDGCYYCWLPVRQRISRKELKIRFTQSRDQC